MIALRREVEPPRGGSGPWLGRIAFLVIALFSSVGMAEVDEPGAGIAFSLIALTVVVIDLLSYTKAR